MAVDVQTIEGLIQLERGLHLPLSEQRIGKFYSGRESSYFTGSGVELCGQREYIDGDASNIDWKASASMPDDELIENTFRRKAQTATVLVADIADHIRLAERPGAELTPRALGFIAGHLLLRQAEKSGPLVVRFTDGRVGTDGTAPVVFDGPYAARKAVTLGLRAATSSTHDTFEARAAAAKKTGIFRSRKQAEPEAPIVPELLSEAMASAMRRSSRLAVMSRVVVMSDFRIPDFKEVVDMMGSLRRKGNQVIAIELTNPLFRALPSTGIYSAGKAGNNVEIERRETLVAYAEAAAIKQARISESLGRAAHTVVSLDSADTQWHNQLKRGLIA